MTRFSRCHGRSCPQVGDCSEKENIKISTTDSRRQSEARLPRLSLSLLSLFHILYTWFCIITCLLITFCCCNCCCRIWYLTAANWQNFCFQRKAFQQCRDVSTGQWMLWVQEIPSYRFLTPNSEKIENRQDRRITPFQVYKIKTKKERKHTFCYLLAA